MPQMSTLPHLCLPSPPHSPQQPLSIIPARAPELLATEDSPIVSFKQTAIFLSKLGWTVAGISRELLATPSAISMAKPLSMGKAQYAVVALTSNITPLTFEELFDHIPFHRLVDPSLAYDFKTDQYRRLDPNCPKEKLTFYDVHLLKILIMIGWKKKRIAALYQVSAVLVSTYSIGLVHYSPEELIDLLPSLAPHKLTPTPYEV